MPSRIRRRRAGDTAATTAAGRAPSRTPPRRGQSPPAPAARRASPGRARRRRRHHDRQHLVGEQEDLVPQPLVAGRRAASSGSVDDEPGGPPQHEPQRGHRRRTRRAAQARETPSPRSPSARAGGHGDGRDVAVGEGGAPAAGRHRLHDPGAASRSRSSPRSARPVAAQAACSVSSPNPSTGPRAPAVYGAATPSTSRRAPGPPRRSGRPSACSVGACELDVRQQVTAGPSRASATTRDPVRARAAASGPPEDPPATRRASGPSTRADTVRSGGTRSTSAGRPGGGGERGRQRPRTSRARRAPTRRDGSSRGSEELLGGRHRHGRPPPAAGVEPQHLVPGRCAHQPAVAQRVAPRSPTMPRAEARVPPLAAPAPAAPGHEVADVEGHGGADRPPRPVAAPARRRGCRARSRSRRPVSRAQPDAAARGPRLLEDGAEERALAGGVDVVGAGRRGRRPASAGPSGRTAPRS